MITFKQYLEEGYIPDRNRMYHITSYNNLSSIIQSGKLLTPMKQGIMRRGNYGDLLHQYSKGRIHFSSNFDLWVTNLSGMIGDTYFSVLRIKPNNLDKYKIKSTYHATLARDNRIALPAYEEELGGDLFVTRSVPLKDLEIYNWEYGRWVQMSRNMELESPDDTDYYPAETGDGYGIRSEDIYEP